MKRDPRIDEKIAKAAPFAQPILTHWRELVHATVPEVEEAIKWGMPHFVYKRKNLAGMAAFKAHCGVIIHGEGRQSEGMGSYGKVTSLADLPPDEVLAAKLLESKELIDTEGTAVKRPAVPKQTYAMEEPDYVAAALSGAPKAKAFWNTLPPSCKFEYLQWITDAKREETRAKRLAQTLEWLGEGKRRNWKYE